MVFECFHNRCSQHEHCGRRLMKASCWGGLAKSLSGLSNVVIALGAVTAVVCACFGLMFRKHRSSYAVSKKDLTKVLTAEASFDISQPTRGPKTHQTRGKLENNSKRNCKKTHRKVIGDEDKLCQKVR